MKIVILMDSFKGSLDSINCGNAVKQGILKAMPDSEISVFPLADGGEGMARTLSESLNATWIPLSVTGPLTDSVAAGYGYIEHSRTAILEMVSASGLALLTPEQYDPFRTSTYGVGELINHAMEKGCLNFIIGIGGSATNDGGIGMLKALGYQFFDKDGKDVGHGASALSQINQIDFQKVNPLLSECRFQIACDVTNPLCGKNGATYVYGPQKGLLPDQLSSVDEGMRHYAEIVSATILKNVSDIPGTGAAGGLGFAFLSFLNAELIPGAQLILNRLNLEEKIKAADLVITGEGKLDYQTVLGKAPITVARLAKKYQKKVIAFSGCIGTGAELTIPEGIDAFFPVLCDICSFEEALSPEKAKENLKTTAEQVFRLINLYI